MRPGAPLSPGLTEKTRCKPAWFTSGGEVSLRIFWASRGAPATCGPGPLFGAMWLADAPPEGPVEDLRYLRRAGDRPDLAVGRLGYLLQVTEVLRHAEHDHQNLDRAARLDHRVQLAQHGGRRPSACRRPAGCRTGRPGRAGPSAR